MVNLYILFCYAVLLLFLGVVVVLSVKAYLSSPIDKLPPSPLHGRGHSPYDWWGPCSPGVHLYTQKNCLNSNGARALLKEENIWFEEKDVAEFQPFHYVKCGNVPHKISDHHPPFIFVDNMFVGGFKELRILCQRNWFEEIKDGIPNRCGSPG